MVRHETADDLNEKIRNYRQSRRTAVGAVRRWLDVLIADAEAELRRIAPPGDEAPPAPPTLPRPAAAEPRVGGLHLRSTYPLDERAPWQRIRL